MTIYKKMIFSFKETKELLLKYSLPTAKTILLAGTKPIEGELEKATGQVGFPLVLKVVSKDIAHRTELGLVEKDIKNIGEAKEAFFRLSKKPEALSCEGILVQKQVKGIEFFCGLKRDKTFGPVLIFGLGGVFVEVLKDIIFGLCPLSQKEALDLIENIKGKKILDGFRGMPAVDKNALACLLVKLSVLISENPQIMEADFNPIIASCRDILIVDAKLTEGRPL